MNKSAIFSAAHKTAKATRNNFSSYRAALSAALRKAYADSKKSSEVVEIETVWVKAGQGCTYKQADYLTDLLGYMPFPTLTQVQRRIDFQGACDAIDALKSGYEVKFV